jgi:hypothetical protein
MKVNPSGLEPEGAFDQDLRSFTRDQATDKKNQNLTRFPPDVLARPIGWERRIFRNVDGIVDHPVSQLFQPVGEEILIPFLDKVTHENQIGSQLQVSVDGLMPEVPQGSLGEFYRVRGVNRRNDWGEVFSQEVRIGKPILKMVNMNDLWLKKPYDMVIVQGVHDDFG